MFDDMQEKFLNGLGRPLFRRMEDSRASRSLFPGFPFFIYAFWFFYYFYYFARCGMVGKSKVPI
jgi:hypothetical protein